MQFQSVLRRLIWAKSVYSGTSVPIRSSFDFFQSPVTKIFSSCVSMVVEIFSRGELTSESEPFLIEAIGAVVCKAK